MQIVVADDNPAFQEMLRKMLEEWGYEVLLATDGAQAWEQLRQPNGPRLALLDWMMPGLPGAEVCRRVRAGILDRYVYLVLLSARGDSEDIVEGMESGADDYIVKPFQPDELRARLRAGRRVLALQQELVEAREALREQATRDGLTGLWNRKSIFDILEKELSRSHRTGEPLSLLMVDLDGFKEVNDTLGHRAGDDVLRQVGARLRLSVRRYDAVGRYGGDEFLIVLPACALAGGSAQGERVRDAIGSEPFMAGDSQVSLTCSLGVACAKAVELEAPDDLVSEADAALYHAKRAGRDRVEAAPSADAPRSPEAASVTSRPPTPIRS